MGGLIAVLAWVAGAGAQLQQAELWPWAVDGALIVAALILAGLSLRAAPRRPRRVGLAAACFLMALGSTGWRAHERLDAVLAPSLEGQDLVLTGVVSSLPQSSLSGVRFQFRVESATGPGGPVQVPAHVMLGWYRGFDADAMLAAPAQEIRAGERWQLPVRLRRPHGSANPHGFDLELWLFEQGVGASGHVRVGGGRQALRMQDQAGEPVTRLRQDVRDAIFREVADPVAAGVIAALVVGDQAAIGREEWDLFRVTGVAHLMSISGLHVTMFAWLAAGVVGRLWRLHPRWMLAVPAPVAARWGGLACAAAYALFAGWGVPAQRTVWMLAAVVLVRSIGWRWPPWAAVVAAGWVVLAVDPWALLQPGFWLSFVAVALLMGSEPAQRAIDTPRPGRGRALGRALVEGLRTQVVATVGLAPLTLVFFQQLSLVGFLANLVAVPWVSFVVTPLDMLGMAWPALWSLAEGAVVALTHGLEAASAWPLAVWQAAAAPAWAVAAGLFGGALAVLPLPWRLRGLALPLMLPLLLPPVPRPATGQFEAVVADVGQGTAVLVRTRSHLLVYDAGPQYSPESDAGQRVLLPLLMARGEPRIDLLMLSHRDLDHVGGAKTLLQHRQVKAISSSLEPAHPLRQGGPPHGDCVAGQRWDWDGVRFSVLHPVPGEALQLATALARAEEGMPVTSRRGRLTPNAVSCVLHVQDAQGRALLLTGDIEAMQELRLSEQAGTALSAEVVLVPHHGSRTSSTAAFIEAAAPRVAVAQAAYRSRFGHPAPDVVARYVDRGVEFVRSDRCGAWTRHADGQGSCQRRTAARYWHHRDHRAAP